MFRNFKTPIISLYRDFAMKTVFTERMNVENLVLLSQHSPAEPCAAPWEKRADASTFAEK